MRTLAEPAVLKSSALAAGLMSVACYPRLATAAELRYPVWYLEALLFLGGMVLWAFAFAWYPKYTGRPLFTLRSGWRLWTLATVAGIGGAVLLHYLVDPALRARTPSEFPPTLLDWVSRVLFSLTFTQLLLIFAPFAWLLRLFQRTTPAVVLTVLFGLAVLAARNQGGPPMPAGLLTGLIIVRVTAGLLSVFLFLRGGVLLVWWCALILQSRHLFELSPP
jgi:hypothetical protein